MNIQGIISIIPLMWNFININKQGVYEQLIRNIEASSALNRTSTIYLQGRYFWIGNVAIDYDHCSFLLLQGYIRAEEE